MPALTLTTILRGLLLLTPAVGGRQLSNLENILIAGNYVAGGENTSKLLNVSSCPGTICIFTRLKYLMWLPNAY